MQLAKGPNFDSAFNDLKHQKMQNRFETSNYMACKAKARLNQEEFCLHQIQR